VKAARERPTAPGSRAGATLRRAKWVRRWCILALWCAGVREGRGQDPPGDSAHVPPVDPMRAQAPAVGMSRAVHLTASAGISRMVFDVAGDESVTGLTLRGGFSPLSALDVTAAVEHWPALAGRTGWDVQLESSFYPIGRRLLSPYLLVGLGYFVANDPDPTRFDRRGVSNSLALGVSIVGRPGFGARLEGALRVDAGSHDPQLRILATFAPRSRERPSRGAEARGALYWMVPVSGPWRFRTAAYAVKFVTPVNARDGVGLATLLAHWRIPRADDPSGYTWDTRTAIMTLGWQHQLPGRPVSLNLEVGPAVSLMVEGPDAYLRPGAHLEIGSTLEVGPAPLTMSVGWLWLSRERVSTTPGTDQHGVMLSVGLRL